MSDCCTSCDAAVQPIRRACPVNGIEYGQVSSRTVVHHVSRPWQRFDAGRAYYFCEDPACDVVYFGDDDSILAKTDLRTVVGIKNQSAHSTLCYCFGVTRQQALADGSIRQYVTHQTKDQVCDCEVRNPSGRCCLKDFPES